MILFRYRSEAVPLQFWSVMVGNGVLRSVTVKLLRDEIIKIDIKKFSKLRALIKYQNLVYIEKCLWSV
jgi:hypothetical protein